MDKILIVGHKSSRYKSLEEILKIYGMSNPLHSYTYNMTPQQITAKLLKASSDKPLKSTNYAAKDYSKALVRRQKYSFDNSQPVYIQKHPKNMWDKLSFDLLLANIDQSLWGWSDDKAIELLEYWAELDEDMAFILAYDQPKTVIQLNLQDCNPEDLDETSINQQLQDWVNYNISLIDFYKKYPERCMLVNCEQVVNSSNEYVESVAKKISWQVDAFKFENIESITNVTNGEEFKKNLILINFFIEQLLKQNDAVDRVFLHLQKIADISLVMNFPSKSPIMLLKEVILQQKDIRDTKQKTQQIESELAEAHQQLISCSHENSQVILQFHQVQEELEQQHLVKLSQLHQVQEELEKYQLESQQSQKKIREVKQELKENIKTEQKNTELAKFELVKLQKELNQTKQELQYSKETKKENELLLTQLHQVQEELEKYYLKNQNSNEKKEEVNQPLYYGAADRIKKDLPYRLGSTMVRHSKSPKNLATLPFALAKEYKQFAKNNLNERLPDLREYTDAYEAEKVKNHLSYRLGKALTDGINSPKEFIKLPVKFGRELIDFKKNRNNL